MIIFEMWRCAGVELPVTDPHYDLVKPSGLI